MTYDHAEQQLAALLVYPELQRLIELRDAGWFFQPVLVDAELELLAGARLWPSGWSDALAIRSQTDSHGYRCDPTGGEVWHREGSLTEVVATGIKKLEPVEDPP